MLFTAAYQRVRLNIEVDLSKKFYGNYVEKYCPTNPCIRSNIFCVEEELGNGICEDYNNGPYCDYDLGDCCGPTTAEKDDCCICSCHQDYTDKFW